jgi:hypothetical protein
MTPPPKPETLIEDTVCCAVANGPRLASRMAAVGSGPRSYGLAARAAVPPASEPAINARMAAAAASRRLAPVRVGMVDDCTSGSSGVGGSTSVSLRPDTCPTHR